MVSIFAILYFPWLRIYDPEKFLLQAISLFSSSFRSDFSLLLIVSIYNNRETIFR